MTVHFTDNQHNICSLCLIEHVRVSSLVMQRLAIFSRLQTQIDSRMDMQTLYNLCRHIRRPNHLVEIMNLALLRQCL